MGSRNRSVSGFHGFILGGVSDVLPSLTFTP